MLATCPAHLIIFDFAILIMSGEEFELWANYVLILQLQNYLILFKCYIELIFVAEI
jgi:hypothetical protein